METKDGLDAGVITSQPQGRDIPFDFDGRMVTEFFSKL
jgi:hypothetical protein